ncbi:MAG: PAS domain S-box protein [Terracidiphilus sp.]
MVEATFDIALRASRKVLAVSETVQALLGFVTEDFLSSEVLLSDRIHLDDVDVAKRIISMETPHEPGTFNIRLRHADGRIRCVSGSYQKTASINGEVILHLRLQDARSIWKSHDRQSISADIEAMMDNTDDFIFFKDRNHVFTAASQNMTDALDPARQGTSLLGLTDYDLFPEEYADIYYRLEKQVLAGMPVASEVHEAQTVDGRKAWLDSRIYPINDRYRKITGLFGISRDITDRMKAEQALRASEEALREAQIIAELGSYVLDVRTGVWTSTEVMDALLGISKDYERTVAGWTNLLHPEDRFRMTAYLDEEVIRKGQPFNREYRIVRQNDQMERWVWGLGRLDFDTEGRPLVMRGVIQDITERKLSEHALRESKKLLELLIEHAPVSLSMFDNKMRYLAVSRRCRMDFGLGDRDIIGHSHYEILPGIADQFKEVHQRALAGETIRSKDERYEKPDGTVLWGRSEVLPWRTGDGSIGGIILFTEDLTERKESELALRESRELFKLFIQHAPAALAMLDRDMRYLAASRRWLEDYGLSGREIIGSSYYEVLPEIPESWRESHRRAMAGEIIQGDVDCLQREDGRGQWLKRAVRPWRTGDGAIGGIVIFTEDITQEKAAQDRLNLTANVFAQASEGIVITDASGSILEVNDAFTRITGYNRDEAIGHNPRILKSGRQSEEFYVDMWRDLNQTGRWSGEIWNRAKDGKVYAEMLTIRALRDQSGNTERYLALFSDVTPIKEQERKLERIAHHDVLTGLPNRTLLAKLLHEILTRASLSGGRAAIAYVDLDNFKAVNERHGRGIGDQVLVMLAQRMKRALRRGDTLAHLGGDEFVVVLPEVADTEESWKVINRLMKVASDPVELGDRTFQLSISVGVTFFPQTATDADQLLRQADQAMYIAKQEGRNRYHVFDLALDRSARDRHENLERIRLALAANEFVLFYQPKVNMCTGAVLGAEALIRWLHPERGLLPPGEFLPAIEGHPIAVEIGKWVIENALIQMEKWRADGLEVSVSVNIGADQLQQADFVDLLNSLLVAHPTIPPHMLELEVLESSAFRDAASASEVIRACKRLGVSSALDDFGTGYASLAYLKRLPVEVLKIDQTFVRDMLEDPEDLAIIEGMLGLATAFRCHTVAEGVETVEHGLMLLRLGCQVAQGYGIARPMQASDFPAWAASWHPDPKLKNVLSFDPGNRPVLYAGVEHRAWVVAIEDFLNGKRQNAPVLDINQCRLGTWLRSEALVDGVALPRRGGLLGFRNIDDLHQKIHMLALEILSLSGEGRKAEAMDRIPELHELRDDLFDKVNNLLQP